MSHSRAPRALALSLAGAAAVAVMLALPAAGNADQADGSYSGTSAVSVGVGNSMCGKDFKMTAKVVDGGFLYTWDSANHVNIPVKIAADGTVTGEGGVGKGKGATATGKLTGRSLEIELKGQQCSRHLSLKKA